MRKLNEVDIHAMKRLRNDLFFFPEEILSSDHAVWWSPDSRHLAYLSFNDTEVQTFAFDTYGYDANPAKQYSNSTKIRYPKVRT